MCGAYVRARVSPPMQAACRRPTLGDTGMALDDLRAPTPHEPKALPAAAVGCGRHFFATHHIAQRFCQTLKFTR